MYRKNKSKSVVHVVFNANANDIDLEMYHLKKESC